jgi:mannose-6-phosphate isomerase-like protein (cupin superfamily)
VKLALYAISIIGGKLEAINLKAEAAKILNLFEYKTIAKMNGHIFTLIKAKNRTLDFHTHQDSDEAFYIVEGQMKLEFRDKIVHLNTGDMCVVPKGIEHRPVCEKEVTAMLIEIDGTLTPENTGGTYE